VIYMGQITDGYLALAVAVLYNRPLTPEMAFQVLAKGPQAKTALGKVLTEADTEDMIRLKKELSWDQVGYIYGITGHAAFARVKNYLKKKKRRCLR